MRCAFNLVKNSVGAGVGNARKELDSDCSVAASVGPGRVTFRVLNHVILNTV